MPDKWKLYIWTDGRMALSVPPDQKDKAKAVAEQIKEEVPKWLAGETKVIIFGGDIEIVREIETK